MISSQFLIGIGKRAMIPRPPQAANERIIANALIELDW